MIVNGKNYFSMIARNENSGSAEKSGSAEEAKKTYQPKSLADFMGDKKSTSESSAFSDKVTLSKEAVAILMKESPETLEQFGFTIPDEAKKK